MSELPEGITICWQYRGYHANGAGPCFDTVEQAVAHREFEARRWAEALDAEVRRYSHLKTRYDAEGWPDGREVMGENGEPKLLYRIERDGIKVAASTRLGAARMFERVLARREERRSLESTQGRGSDAEA